MSYFGVKIQGKPYKKRQAVYGILLNKGRIASVKVNSDFFLPGGGVEPNEDIFVALKREFIEEIGSAIKINQSLGTAIEYFYSKNDAAYFESSASFYLVQFIDKNKIKTEHNHKLVWLPQNKVSLLRFEYFKWAVNVAIQNYQ